MLQNEVRALQGIGKVGVISRASDNFKNVIGGVATDDNIFAGGFVQLASDTNDNNTTQIKGATGQAITNKIIGVALFEYQPICGVNSSLKFLKGDNVNVITTGNVFIEFKQTCKIGQYIVIKTDDGTLAVSNTGTEADYTNTGWKVLKTASTAGDNIIEITKAL